MTELARTPRRTDPEIRRQALVEAALRSVASHGHDGLTVRRIAAEANVSIGLINHYFSGIDALVAQAYEKMARDVTHWLIGAAGGRLDGFIMASFSEKITDPKLLSMWVVFWSLVPHSPDMQRVQRETSLLYRNTLKGLIEAEAAQRNRPVDASLAALGLAAMLDGLWVERSLNPAAFTAEEGIVACRRWVDCLFSAPAPADA